MATPAGGVPAANEPDGDQPGDIGLGSVAAANEPPENDLDGNELENGGPGDNAAAANQPPSNDPGGNEPQAIVPAPPLPMAEMPTSNKLDLHICVPTQCVLCGFFFNDRERAVASNPPRPLHKSPLPR